MMEALPQHKTTRSGTGPERVRDESLEDPLRRLDSVMLPKLEIGALEPGALSYDQQTG